MSNVENLPPHVIQRVSKEMMDLTKNPPEGIRIAVNEEDITDIQATIDGPCEFSYASFIKHGLQLTYSFVGQIQPVKLSLSYTCVYTTVFKCGARRFRWSSQECHTSLIWNSPA